MPLSRQGFLILVWGMSQFGLIAIISKDTPQLDRINILAHTDVDNRYEKPGKIPKDGKREALLPPGMDNRIFEDAEAQ